ncbi:MAG: DUF4209 domain-containing protein [Treponema sp.]|uniref:DUF4209 domain-containing protein n=1 Tax=Treponema sp. TaxID=166 RepID=UPI00298E45AB|nr:DUF4209 domain-containing protein [Treponema sp.]MCQ2601384.1 DUF4209 domain-containing protein [Treponema sp.]
MCKDEFKNVKLDIINFHSALFNEQIAKIDKPYAASSICVAIDKLIDEESNLSKKKILCLIHDCLTVHISKESIVNPFEKLLFLEDDDINFLKELLPYVDNKVIQGRLADIIWSLSSKREVKFAEIVIDSYFSLPIDSESFFYVQILFERALVFVNRIKNNSDEKKKEFCSNCFSVLISIDKPTTYFSYHLAELILKYNLCETQNSLIAEKLECLAECAKNTKEFDKAKDFFELAASFYYKDKDNEHQNGMIYKAAKTYQEYGELLLSKQDGLCALSIFEVVVKKYQSITKEYKQKYKVAELLSQVYKFIDEAGKISLEQFHEFKSEPIDIADFVKHSVEVCAIEDLYEALLNLLELIPFANYKDIKNCTVNLNREYPLQSIFSSMYLNDEGKLIGFVPPSDLKTTDDQILYSDMVKYYYLSLPIYVRGALIPGIKTIIQNNKVSLVEVNHIVEKSGLIQRSQIPIISKGIAAGLDFDFATALSLLVPQIESIVRIQLKKYGVKTTYTDFKKGGVETENSIDSLIRLPETKKIFGEDIVFEMDVLFCQPIGGNLRNKIAHGLMSYEEFFSDCSIFAFGFILKLIFNPFWNNYVIQIHEEGKK